MTLAFLSGAIMLGALACGLFFLKFWRSSGDPLFLWFSLAFAFLGAERIMLLTVSPANEFRPYVYGIRLLAFTMIVIAVIQKNRATRR